MHALVILNGLLTRISGLARTFLRGARPGVASRSIKPRFAPALATRFASTDAAKDGQIHQVIGAVVDVSAVQGFEKKAALLKDQN